MPVTPGTEHEEAGGVCAGVDLSALVAAARRALDALPDEAASSGAELFLAAERRLTLEHEVSTGASSLSEGESVVAAARVEGEKHWGFAAVPVGTEQDLTGVLDAARNRPPPGVGAPPPSPLPLGEGRGEGSRPPVSPPGPPPLNKQRALELAQRVANSVVPRGAVVQAAVLTQSATWSTHLRRGTPPSLTTNWREELFIRCETSRGAVVDAVASTPDGAEGDLAALQVRLADAVEALEGPASAVDPALPLVLRPAVAAPLVAGLAWLLRGDVAAATPALARAVGRKLFPSVLTVEDDPRNPRGTRHRNADDEGLPARTLRLVDEGRLQGFLHSAATASRLGAEPNGRGLRTPATAPPAPEPVNLCVRPRGAAPPEDYTELVARVETFTTMPKPGTVSLMAGGWEVRGGRRVRRIAPVELDLPVLETFRVLRGVGADLTFFPTAEGCGTPTLLFPALLAG